jgi:SAM-dependent methyltransferase
MAHRIADYYDVNTRRFLFFRRSLNIGAIHRRLYAAGKRGSFQAAHHSNELVLETIRKAKAARVLDLGCGIGGSIRYLSQRHPAEYFGITISPVQVRTAAELGTRLELTDYLNPEWFSSQDPMDVMYAIESMQHNPDHRRLASNLRMLCHRGTRLIVIDDFLSPDVDPQHPLVVRFHRHWRVPGVTAVQNLVQAYAGEGFILERNIDLSQLMARRHMLRILGNAASGLLNAFRLHGGYFDNILGGNALLNLYQRGMAEYRMLEFSREGP